MAGDEKYRLTLEGSDIDEALLRLANYEDEGLVLGSRKGVMLGPESEYYHKNARYYAELAQSAVPGDTTSAVRWDIDQSALTDADRELARKNIRAGGSNRNLLDNPWFTVNQRGQSSYTSGYTVDRWQLALWNATSPTLTVNNNGSVTLASTTADSANTCGLWQIIENGTLFAGKTVTLSVQIDAATTAGKKMFICGAANGTRYAETTLTQGLNVLTATLPSSITGLSVLIGNHASSGGRGAVNLTISAVKLELGSVSTLANDAPPNFAAELAKCQHYLYGLTFPGYAYTGQICFALDAQNINWNLTTPVPMVQNRLPSISVTNSLYANGVAISGITIVNYPYGNNIKISGQAGGMTNGQLYPITTSANEVKVLISTEL